MNKVGVFTKIRLFTWAMKAFSHSGNFNCTCTKKSRTDISVDPAFIKDTIT